MTNDGPWINNQDNWSNWSYDRIRSMLNDINTGVIESYADSWGNAGDKIADTLAEFIQKLNGTLDGQWSGAAAAQAQAVLDGYRTLPDLLRGQAHTVSDLARSTGQAVVQARNTVNGIKAPQQPNVVDNVLNGLSSGALAHFGVPDGATAAEQQKAANSAAQRAMTTMVTPAYNHADLNMPTFEPIKQPGNPSPTPVQPDPRTRRGGDNPVGGNGSGGQLPTFTGSTGSTATSASAWAPPPPVAGSPTGAPVGSTATGTAGFAGLPGGAGTGPGGVGVAGTGLPGGLGGAGGFGPAGAGLAGGFGSGVSGRASAGGSSGVGDDNLAAEEATNAERAAVAERGGATPGGMMGGRGDRKSEDDEHRSPNYVKGPDDLFGYGADGPMVISPVIGAETE